MARALHQQLKARIDALTALKPSEPPAPWRHVATLQIGGLTEVGFANSSDLLLVISSAGRGVVDTGQGKLIARDDDDRFAFDSGNLIAEGIGPINGVKVRVSGLRGGGLSTHTADGWSVERQPLAWPDEELILSPPGQSMLWTPTGKLVVLTKLAGFASEIRVFGFSPTGRAFIIATASDVAIFSR
ncbi:MAG: hypothetical protein QM759_10555 [Terricaulis sp.]